MKPRTILVILLAVGLPLVAGACPMCKDAYSDGSGTSVAAAFNPSIIFMIVTTFAVFFAVAFRIWWSYHKRGAAQRPPAR